MRSGNPRRPTSDMSLGGIYYAIVTQNKDEEMKLARVKVRFPWMPGGDQDQTHWARVAVPMIGGEFGAFTLPEVEDTVLVMFIAGDIRWPVIIGGSWNHVDTPPEVNENGKNDFRFIKSRAGHRLLFDDSSKTKIALTDFNNGNSIGVGEFGEGGDSPNKFEIKAPSAINGSPQKGVGVTSSEGDVNIWCPNGTLTIEAQHAELTASDKAELKAGGAMTLEGGANGVVNGSAGVKLDGSKVNVN
ncbi:MAG TPA: phage baseplate assembly protein V [Kofleriaceae bacterium]|nr:phage baseplate assembly protein V [Kofleriaceae bacterium]